MLLLLTQRANKGRGKSVLVETGSIRLIEEREQASGEVFTLIDFNDGRHELAVTESLTGIYAQQNRLLPE